MLFWDVCRIQCFCHNNKCGIVTWWCKLHCLHCEDVTLFPACPPFDTQLFLPMFFNVVVVSAENLIFFHSTSNITFYNLMNTLCEMHKRNYFLFSSYKNVMQIQSRWSCIHTQNVLSIPPHFKRFPLKQNKHTQSKSRLSQIHKHTHKT